jgi:hypothetical protein
MLTTACVGMLAPLQARAQVSALSAVEFFHSLGGSFFTTFPSAEATLLDTGATTGWRRAFTEFKVEHVAGPGLFPVCRFYTARFAPKSAHFFTAFPEECAALKANPDWTYEGIAFYARLPDALGKCVVGTMPIYRCYNGGTGGAPRHRFTPYFADACSFGAGSVREGLGPDGVAFCAPESLSGALAMTQHMSIGTWEFSYVVNGKAEIGRYSFGDAIPASPGPLPAPPWPDVRYVTHALGLGGSVSAGWDPIASKMVVFLGYTVIDGFPSVIIAQFDFDGIIDTNGCVFVWDLLDQNGRGPCNDLKIVHRF